MNKKWLVISSIFIFILFLTVGVGLSTNNDLSLQAKNLSLQDMQLPELQSQNMGIELTGEAIEIKEKDDQRMLVSAPLPKTREQLLGLKQKALERLNSLKPNEQINAVITFNKPLDEKIIGKQIASEISINSLNFISSPEGTGNADYPIIVEERQRLEELEQMVTKNMQAFCNNLANELEKVKPDEKEMARQSFTKQCESYKNFKLIKGFVSARVSGTKEKLLKLSNNLNVFLVDVGPIELLQTNPNIKIAIVKDVWYEYTTYYSPS